MERVRLNHTPRHDQRGRFAGRRTQSQTDRRTVLHAENAPTPAPTPAPSGALTSTVRLHLHMGAGCARLPGCVFVARALMLRYPRTLAFLSARAYPCLPRTLAFLPKSTGPGVSVSFQERNRREIAKAPLLPRKSCLATHRHRRQGTIVAPPDSPSSLYSLPRRTERSEYGEAPTAVARREAPVVRQLHNLPRARPCESRADSV
jgi:hypothetical protein